MSNKINNLIFKHNEKCMTTYKIGDREPLVIWDCDVSDGYKNQLFIYDIDKNNIVDQVSGKCVSNVGGSNQKGTFLILDKCAANRQDQIWVPNGLGFTNGTKNGNENNCMDMTAGDINNGTAIQIWPCSGGPNQNWKMEKTKLAPFPPPLPLKPINTNPTPSFFKHYWYWILIVIFVLLGVIGVPTILYFKKMRSSS